MYDIIPIAGWNKRTEILIRNGKKLEAIWSKNYRRYRRTYSRRDIEKMFILQDQEFQTIKVLADVNKETFTKARYPGEMENIVKEFIPLLMLEKPHFVMKHLIIKRIRERHYINGKYRVMEHQTHYLIIISEQLNSYIQVQEIAQPEKYGERIEAKYLDKIDKLKDLKEYLRHKFSETIMNKDMKEQELKDLFEHCKQYMEGGEDDVCNPN